MASGTYFSVKQKQSQAFNCKGSRYHDLVMRGGNFWSSFRRNHYHAMQISVLQWLLFIFSLQGQFEILSLSGSFFLAEDGVQRSRNGGLSVSLAGPDGRLLGGGVAGLLVAASPVQVLRFSAATSLVFQTQWWQCSTVGFILLKCEIAVWFLPPYFVRSTCTPKTRMLIISAYALFSVDSTGKLQFWRRKGATKAGSFRTYIGSTEGCSDSWDGRTQQPFFKRHIERVIRWRWKPTATASSHGCQCQQQ